MKKILILFLLFPVLVSAQIGGQNVYDFLNLSPSPRLSALGGECVSRIDEDAAFAFRNPALLSDSASGNLNLSVFNYISDISFGSAQYARHFDKIGTFHGGLQYVSYGNFTQADEFGNITGSYRSGDLAFVTGYSRAIRQFRVGINWKLINANLANYSSFGTAFDLGAAYSSKNQLFNAGICFQNIGSQLSKFTPTGEREKLPFEIQAGISFKPQYMPLRFYLTGVQLQTPVLIYDDPDKPVDKDFNGDPIPPKKRIGDKIMGHFVIGTEFLLGKNLRLRAGYNHLRRIELRSEDRAGLTGFSLGFGLKISRFRLDYGFVRYAAGMNTHHFGISTNLSSFRKKS